MGLFSSKSSTDSSTHIKNDYDTLSLSGDTGLVAVSDSPNASILFTDHDAMKTAAEIADQAIRTSQEQLTSLFEQSSKASSQVIETVSDLAKTVKLGNSDGMIKTIITLFLIIGAVFTAYIFKG